MAATAAQFGTDLLRPTASLLHLGAAAAICAPLLAAAACDALLPDVAPATLEFGYPATGRLQLALTRLPPTRPALLPALADQLIEVALTRLLPPFTAALTAVVPLSAHVVTGNVFSALAAAARLVAPAADGARARALVALVARKHPPFRDAGELNWRSPDDGRYFRRRNCCLFYQVPGGGTCGDCILAS